MDLDDKEIAAMRELYRLLEPFDQQARMRIANYVISRLETEYWAKQNAAHAQENAHAQAGQCQQNVIPAAARGNPLNYAIDQLGR